MHDTSRKIKAVTARSADLTATMFKSAVIPRSFMLGGLTINVVRDDDLVNSRSIIGEARYHEQTIRIDTSVAPRQTVEQSFFHELTHWIFFIMNEDELRNNEKLVDLFAHFLYQALMTATYEPEIPEDSGSGQSRTTMTADRP